jgi:hypothetical protein
VDGIGKSINGIGVVERLSAEGLVEEIASLEGRAVIDVGIGLDDPDEFLARMVEVELDLVGGGTHGFVTGELNLFNEVLMRVLGELAALLGIQKDIINVEGGGDERLLVASGGRLGTGSGGERLDGPENVAERAEVDVDTDFVILHNSRSTLLFRIFLWL